MEMAMISDGAEEIMRRVWENHGQGQSFEAFCAAHSPVSQETRVRRQVERDNAAMGSLHLADGYNCRKCNNRGYVFFAREYLGSWSAAVNVCDCQKVRNSIKRMEKSGLKNSLKRLDEFEAEADWQKDMLEVAKAYVAANKSHGESLFLGGQVGCGKTHVGTAVCRELLHQGMAVLYMPWVTEAKRIKDMADEAGQLIAEYSRAEVLYIDDLFKPYDNQGAPTAADVRLAYDIINYRYINHLPMIISSEKYINELLAVDEGTVSRVYEMARRYTVNIKRDPARNYRMRGVEIA